MNKTTLFSVIGPVKRFQLKIWPRGDCWEWRGGINPTTGYGTFCVIWPENVDAHRFAYTLAKGTIPAGLQIDHLCRHRWCVRPSHLEAVPFQVNIARGKHHHRSKTCCPKGHAYTVRQEKRGPHRICRQCMNARARARRAAERVGSYKGGRAEYFSDDAA